MTKKPSYTSVDLFAGAGGLSLGLERAGFEVVYVNELHQAAMDTFLINRPSSVVQDPTRRSGDIFELTNDEKKLKDLRRLINGNYGNLDLVVGGPPCQGYSSRGRRVNIDINKIDIPSNHLYREMIKVINELGPKLFLFENVEGLLRGKWTADGVNGEIWEDVYSAFSSATTMIGGRSIGYHLGWHLVKGHEYGVPQNRPRVLLVGIRGDLVPKLNQKGRAGGLLPDPIYGAPDPVDVLSDLATPGWANGADLTYKRRAKSDFQKEVRVTRNGRPLVKGDPLNEQDYTNHSDRVIQRFEKLIAGEAVPKKLRSGKQHQVVLPKRWPQGIPSITMTSLPDDCVHYGLPRILTVREWARFQTFPDWYQFCGPRTTGGRRRAGSPEVGEWDRELPKYTQIGNAVPVKLGDVVGRHFIKILEGLE